MAVHAHLPITSLPVWQTLNDVSFVDAHIQEIPHKGFGLVAARSLTTSDRPLLVSVPHGLVLNAAAVEQYAKQDRNFRQLLDAVGHQTERGDVLLFLLVQVVLGLRPSGANMVALPTPWTEYAKFLPDDVPLPTMWSDTERLLLHGTSLEDAVEAKKIALEYEFDFLRDKSSDIPCWQAALWEGEGGPGIQLEHWFLADAWYRSRCLDLPRSGPAMVPCIDLVNHGTAPNAYYEENGLEGSEHDGAVLLLLRPQQSVAASDEITISYSGGAGDGHGQDDRKPASEMLFSYGFIDPHSARQSLVLPFHPFPDDPLAKAKLHAFGTPSPRLEIERLGADDDEDDGETSTATVRWTCPFAYLMCVNQEDGLDLRLRQETDGSQQLRVFWQEEDVTDKGRDFESLTRTHPLAAVFQLRVLTVLQEVLEARLERMQGAAAEVQQQQQLLRNATVRAAVAEQAALLRDMESRIISSALEILEAEAHYVQVLTWCLNTEYDVQPADVEVVEEPSGCPGWLQGVRKDGVDLQGDAMLYLGEPWTVHASVVAYLGSMDITENDLADEEASNEEEGNETPDEEKEEEQDVDFS